MFLRLIEPRENEPGKLEDVRFSGYRPLAGGWVAVHVDLWVEGRKIFTEYYSNIRVNVPLDPDIFDPKQFTTKHWEK